MSDKETDNIKNCLNDEEDFDINNLEIVRVFLNFLPLGVLLGLYFRWKKWRGWSKPLQINLRN
jgi:hypothetical protein